MQDTHKECIQWIIYKVIPRIFQKHEIKMKKCLDYPSFFKWFKTSWILKAAYSNPKISKIGWNGYTKKAMPILFHIQIGNFIIGWNGL